MDIKMTSRRTLQSFLACFAVAVFLLLWPAIAVAGQDKVKDKLILVPKADEGARPDSVSYAEFAPAAAKPALPNIRDHTAFTAWLDGTITTAMKLKNIPSAVISITLDGKLYIVRGYGYSDARGSPMDPYTHMFRVGSISKTMVWVSVMQLVEKGMLDLDTPINEYLSTSLQVPSNGYDDPILLKHLMNHSAGFEDNILGISLAKNGAGITALADYLKRYRPKRVRPAGGEAVFSNYSTALAAFIVAEVSGEKDFESYVEKNIFSPLNMHNSTFREPHSSIEDGIAAATADKHANDFIMPIIKAPYDFLGPLTSAGGLTTTAGDMARYMLALLNGGNLEGRQILSGETFLNMQAKSHQNHPAVSSLAHGFLTRDYDQNISSVGHSGTTQYFSSNMELFPDQALGIFISLKGRSGRTFAQDLPHKIISRYYLEPSTLRQPPSRIDNIDERYSGIYLNNRRSFTNIEALYSLANFTRVEINGEYLITHRGGSSKRWKQVSDLSFFSADGTGLSLGFGENEQGKIIKLYDSSGITTADRASFFQTPNLFMILFSLTVISAIVTLIAAARRKLMRFYANQRSKRSTQLYVTTASTWLIAIAASLWSIINLMSDSFTALSNFPDTVSFLTITLINIAFILTLVSALNLYSVWRERYWTWMRCLRYTTSIAIWSAWSLTLWSWNVIGYNYY